MRDLGSGFCYQEDQVGNNTRAQASLDRLRLLNPDVDVSVHESEVTIEFLREFDVVVFTDYYDRKKLIQFNRFCRSRSEPIGFLIGGVLGLYGFIFVDFGYSFKVVDSTGEEPGFAVVTSVSNSNPIRVEVTPSKAFQFSIGDKIRFTNMKGMDELNNKEYRIIGNNGINL